MATSRAEISAFFSLTRKPSFGNFNLYLGKQVCNESQELMRKNLGIFFGLPRLGVGAALVALFAFTSASRAGLLYEMTLTDVQGAGVASATAILGVEVINGQNYATSGSLNLSGSLNVSGTALALTIEGNSWNISGGTVQPPPNLKSPSGNFVYDNWVDINAPASGVFLSATVGLLFTDPSGDELNIWENSPNNYSLFVNLVGTGSQYQVNLGPWPGIGNPDDYLYLVGGLTAVPEPINWALAGFGLLFVGGTAGRFYLGRRRFATAS
jgi:hypothetical protein